MDDAIFHLVNASGYSEYRRGMPFNPKKCWGKKVMFTPRNIIKNCLFSFLGFILIPNIIGIQCTTPAMIANTAPILKT